MSSPDDPSTSRDSSDPDRCLQFPSSLAPVSSGLCRMCILNYPEYVRQLLTVAIVTLPQRRVERAQGRQSGARRGRLNGKQPRGQPSAIKKI